MSINALPLTSWLHAMGGSGIRPKGLNSRESEAAAREAEFDALICMHGSALYRVAWRLAGNIDETEDLIQETLIEAYQSFGSFRTGTHFDRWVFCIMRNTWLDTVRKRNRTKTESLDSELHDHSGRLHYREIVDGSGTAETELLARTLDGPIQDALDLLPADFKIVVILADVEGYSYEEVSQAVGCPVGTVRSRLHRARAILRSKLSGYV